MPVFHSGKESLSGVPLGGIGAGKFELLPNGLFNSFTFLNNWSCPLNGRGEFPGVLGYHLGVFVEHDLGERLVRLIALIRFVTDGNFVVEIFLALQIK